MKIGVFDSGVGGQSVVNAINKAMPEHEVIYVEDHENLPYGTKTPQQLHELVLPLVNRLVDKGCKVIVIACNTVTTTIIDKLRQEISVPLVGMEPMVKPAAELTKTGKIAVCATPTTLASKRYNYLKATYAKNIEVFEPDCSEWAKLVESNRIDKEFIQGEIETVCQQGADVIVLGCTHFHWIEDIVNDVVRGRATVLQPEKPVIDQLFKVLKQIV